MFCTHIFELSTLSTPIIIVIKIHFKKKKLLPLHTLPPENTEKVQNKGKFLLFKVLPSSGIILKQIYPLFRNITHK